MSTRCCAGVAELDTWSNLDWKDGIQVDDLDDLQTLVVETRNSTYEIVVMNARKADVLVRGGRFFPVYAPVQLSGASLGGSFLKLYGIYTGFSMELHTGGERIITSPVKRISIVKDAGLPS